MAYEAVECIVSMTWEQTIKNLRERLGDLEKGGYDIITVVPFSVLGSTNRLVIITREKQ